MDNNSLVPRLRFKEFSGEWEEKKLGDLTNLISERNKENKKLPIYSISNVAGFIPQSEQFEGVDSHTRGYDISLYKIIRNNTFAYNPARINVGSIGYSYDLNDFLISSLYVCFKTKEELEDIYLLHFLKTERFNRAVEQNVEGGIRSYLFYANFSNIDIHVPSTKLEQQKIADTLSSLDTLIQSEQAKLTQLQEHKKGLMQNLFPQEGESVPKVRFKEFENDGEWAEKKIKSIGVVITGGTPNKSKGDYWDGEFIWTTAQDFKSKYIYTSVLKLSDEGKAKMRVIPINSVLVTCIASIGLNAINKVECATNQQINSIVCNPGFYFEFIYYVVESNISRLRDLAGQTAVPIINKRSFEEFVVQIPINKTEQQKIASTLSSLDDLISSQAQRIELLQQHKKGLMQGLFPSAQ